MLRLSPLTKIFAKSATFVTMAVIAGLAMPSLTTAQTQNSEETYRQLSLFGDVFQRVRSDYVEEIEDKELIEAAINGMLTSLDPHSSFLPDDSFKKMQVQTTGRFGGLGIEVTMDSGFVKVVSPISEIIVLFFLFFYFLLKNFFLLIFFYLL